MISIIRVFWSKIGVNQFLFWLIFLLVSLIAGNDLPFFYNLIITIISIICYSTIVYINYNFLIPDYLLKKQLYNYFIWLVGLSILVTPIKIALIFVLSYNYPARQLSILEDQFSQYASVVIFALFSTVLKVINDWAKQLKRQQSLENQQLQSELQFLRNQLNPHFLFNTLNSIYALTLKKSDLAPDVVIKLSEMMRYMIYECNEKFVPLNNDLQYIGHYLELEELRLSKPVDIQFQVIGSTLGIQIAPLILVTFFENSFKHGVNKTPDKSVVLGRLEIDEAQTLLKFELMNSIPPSSSADAYKPGIGLLNVNRRLELLYPNRYKLETEKLNNQFWVRFELKID